MMLTAEWINVILNLITFSGIMAVLVLLVVKWK